MLSTKTLLIVLFLGVGAPDSSVLALVASPHQQLIPRALPAFPEPRASLPDDTPTTKGTALGTVVLLSRTPATDHPVGPFIGMILRGIMALVA